MNRVCYICKEDKLLVSNFHKDKNEKTGYTFACKICRNKRDKDWRKRNPDRVKELNDIGKEKRKQFYSSPEGVISSRKTHLKRKYGITIEQYNELSERQNNLCWICGKPEMNYINKVLCVDHNHETGEIRGLLCGLCNSAIGNFLDNKQLLIKAIKYLEYYENKPNVIM